MGARQVITRAEFAGLYPALIRFARAVAPEGVDAEDLIQAATARLLARSVIRGPVRNLEAYLITSIGNEAKAEFRRSRRTTAARVRSGSEHGDGPADGDIAALLGALPPRQRACIYLRFCEDLSLERTADLLGCRPGTVKSQTAKGLATLRQVLTDSTPSEPEVWT